MKRLIFCLCFLLSFLFCINAVNAVSYASTGVYELYIRTLPDASSLAKTKIPAATSITLISDTNQTGLGCDDNWFEIEYKNYSGYVCSTYLTGVNWEDAEKENQTTPEDSDTSDDSNNQEETDDNNTEVEDSEKPEEIPETTVDIEEIYKQELEKFPESYKIKIEELHKIYPNAIFKVQNVDIKFNDFAIYQYQGYEKGSLTGCLVEKEKGGSLLEDTNGSRDGLKSLDAWAYTALTDTFNTSFYGGQAGRWYAPSLNTVKYYIDARNFLNSKAVFMFEEISYAGDYYLEENIEKLLVGTFMHKTNITGKENTSFARAFIDAGKQNNLNPYFLVSRVLQEIGPVRSSMVSGSWELFDKQYVGYYNFYNVGAAGNSVNETIRNGLAFAKSQGWDNEYDALVEGAVVITEKYVDNEQDTAYFQKFDVYGPCYGWNQYMQNIEAPLNESYKTYNGYDATGLLDSNFVFRIPVYNEMPDETKLDDSRNSNNYLRDLTINGTTIEGFDYQKQEYTINVSSLVESVEIAAIKSSSKSTVVGTGPFEINDTEQTKEIIVTAENGSKRTYKIIVTKDESLPISVSEILNTMLINNDGTYLSSIAVNTKASDFIKKAKEVDDKVTITIKNNKDEDKTEEVLATGDKVNIISGEENKTFNIVIYGDVDGNGAIDKLDALAILRHHYEYITHTDAYKVAADVDKKGTIDKIDALFVLKDFYDYEKIEQ